MFGKKVNQRIYLDWAAASPMSKEVVDVMIPYLSEHFGNPSAIHAEGQITKQAIEAARLTIGRALQVRPEFITFTAGGTEANSLAIVGSVEAALAAGKTYADLELISTRIEHPSVIKTLESLEEKGARVKWCKVDETGKIKIADLQQLLSEKTHLVTLAIINSEIGTIQPVRQIKRVLAEAEKKYHSTILFHVDAAQAPLWLNCQFDSLAADFVSLDTAKCCGPKGLGVLVRSRRAEVLPVLRGGGQESGLRSGTENVAGIVGAARAIELATANHADNQTNVSAVRDQAITLIKEELPVAILNGAVGAGRVANNINISLPGIDTEFATVVLDQAGFAVSTKSACSGAGGGASEVVETISQDTTRASSTLRITIGPDTTLNHIKELVEVLKKHIEQMSLTFAQSDS